jgi:hypothetical protein
MKSKTIPLIVALAIVGGGLYAFFAYGEMREPRPSQSILIGGDRDTHGCIGSAGYSWCAPKNKCLRIWEEPCYANGEEEIQYLLAQKYHKQVSDVTVLATQKTADYMKGWVSFATKGLPQNGGGGMFLAVRAGNLWTLVYDGNGSVDCKAIQQKYNFPTDMLKGFCF